MHLRRNVLYCVIYIYRYIYQAIIYVICPPQGTSVCTLKTQAFAAVPLFGHREIQHTLGQAPKTECGCPNGRRLENRHVRSPFPEKLACYFCKLKFVAQEDV